MVVVLISARYKTILQWLKSVPIKGIQAIKIIKQNGPKIFLYVETSFTYQQVVQCFQKRIHECGGVMYVYQFYSIFQGMIDYNDYLSDEVKLSMPYYQSSNKDILESEYCKK